MRIYLDLDGVIARFAEQSLIVHGKEDTVINKWDYFKDWGMTSAEFWEPIDEDPDFWFNIEPYPWMDDLVKLIESHDPNYLILTSPHDSEYCYSGKQRWLQKYFDFKTPKRAIFTAQKHELARHGAVLIDDSDDNIYEFNRHGGTGILFPRSWNDNKHHLDDPVGFVRGQLEDIADFWS